MNNSEQNSQEKIEELSPKMHHDIMRSVRIVKRRYYLFGLVTGFMVALVVMSWVIYIKMLNKGTFEFLPILADILKSNFSLVTDFGDEIKEFFPVENIEIWVLILFIISLLLLVLFRFRKALFLKVEKFSDRKRDKKDKNN